MWIEIGRAVFDGLLVAGLGKFKKVGKKAKPWDWKKALPTLVIAGLAGGVANWLGLSFDSVYGDFMIIGSTVVVQNLWKVISRRLN